MEFKRYAPGQSQMAFRRYAPKKSLTPSNIGVARLSGARQDPLIKPVIDSLARLGGYDENTLNEMADSLADTRTTNALECVGKWAPTIAGSLTA